MDFGLVLPTMPRGATAEGIQAAAEVANRLGWSTLWVTDHLLVHRAREEDEYAHIFEALTTLAFVGGKHPRLKLGTSAICVPLNRNSKTSSQTHHH